MKFIGSGVILAAIAAFGFEESFIDMNCRHLAANNLVSERRLDLCQRVNNTLNQLQNGVIFYYSPVFPHHLDWTTGQLQYMTTIPRWWYAAAHLPQNSAIAFASTSMSGKLPMDVCYIVAMYLKDPSKLVQTCTEAHRQIVMMEPHIVATIAMQHPPIAQLVTWYGHQTWTQGRDPVLNVPPRPQNAEWLEELYRRWDAEEERAIQMHERIYQPHIRQMRHELEEDVDPDDPWFQPNAGELRWYTALNFYEQAVEEAMTFGERVPRGIDYDINGAMVLLYSSDGEMGSQESDASD